MLGLRTICRGERRQEAGPLRCRLRSARIVAARQIATNWPPNGPKSGQLAGKLRIPLPGFEPRSCRRRSNRQLDYAAQAERTFPSNRFAPRSTSRPARGAIGARRPTRPASARPRVFERAALLPAISEVANRDCRPRRSASSRASNPSGVPALPRADGAERLNARIPHSARAAATEPSYRRRSRRGAQPCSRRTRPMSSCLDGVACRRRSE